MVGAAHGQVEMAHSILVKDTMGPLPHCTSAGAQRGGLPQLCGGELRSEYPRSDSLGKPNFETSWGGGVSHGGLQAGSKLPSRSECVRSS